MELLNVNIQFYISWCVEHSVPMGNQHFYRVHVIKFEIKIQLFSIFQYGYVVMWTMFMKKKNVNEIMEKVRAISQWKNINLYGCQYRLKLKIIITITAILSTLSILSKAQCTTLGYKIIIHASPIHPKICNEFSDANSKSTKPKCISKLS